MATTLTDAALLNNDHRRRRWMIRICISLLLVLPLLTVVAFVLLSSPNGMTSEEALTAFAQLPDPITQEQAERLLGKPFTLPTTNGNVTKLVWRFYKQGLSQIDVFYLAISFDQNGNIIERSFDQKQLVGLEAWFLRWLILKGKW